MNEGEIEQVRRFRQTVTAWLAAPGGRRPDEVADALLGPLSAGQRDRLVAALGEVEHLLTAASVTVAPADPAEPDAEHCLRSYFAELADSYASGFDPALSLLPDAGELRAPRGLFLVARLHGEPVGCAGLKLPAGAAAEVKRMWVAPRARRLGLGRRFLTELEAAAGAAGRTVLRLDTNKELSPAIGLYRSYGFQEVAAFNDEVYADHWFEKRIGGGPNGEHGAGGAG